MYAGSLTSRITIIPRSVDPSDFASTLEYGEARIVPAERVRLSGSIAREVGEDFVNTTVVYRLRDVYPVRENWRLRDEDTGYMYDIGAVERNRLRGFNTLTCYRVNE